jgi:hypothetical protein
MIKVRSTKMTANSLLLTRRQVLPESFEAGLVTPTIHTERYPESEIAVQFVLAEG